MGGASASLTATCGRLILRGVDGGAILEGVGSGRLGAPCVLGRRRKPIVVGVGTEVCVRRCGRIRFGADFGVGIRVESVIVLFLGFRAFAEGWEVVVLLACLRLVWCGGGCWGGVKWIPGNNTLVGAILLGWHGGTARCVEL